MFRPSVPSQSQETAKYAKVPFILVDYNLLTVVEELQDNIPRVVSTNRDDLSISAVPRDFYANRREIDPDRMSEFPTPLRPHLSGPPS